MMRVMEITREAIRNVGPRHWIIGGAGAVTIAVLVYTTAMSAWGALEAEQARRDAGGLVVVVEAAGDADISVMTCEGINGLDGVGAAGGIYGMSNPEYTIVPQLGTVPTLAVTRHALEVWDASVGAAMVVTGEDVSNLHGIVSGTRMRVVDGATGATRTVDAVLRSGVPIEILRSRISVVTFTDARLHTCWVRAKPGLESTVESMTRATLAGTSVVVTRFHPDPLGAPTPLTLWEGYTGALPWLTAGGAMALVIFGVAWSRRAEYAVYRTFGASRSDIALMVAIEVVDVLLPAAALGATYGVVAQAVVHGTGVTFDIAEVCACYVVASCAVALALVPLGVFISMRGNVLEQLKDR
jgi:hypothetical protein